MTDSLSITSQDLELSDGRFDRFGLIGWWDQARLSGARVLVVGAGALGNEIIKNLALLGVGNILVADKDTIENSNLSRSVLYRAADTGRAKATVAAEAAVGIYPELNVHAFTGDIVHDLGAGVYRWADVVIGGLDNREARLAINRQCWRVGRPWIDGAIEVISGVARVFTPDVAQEQPCYECTMSDRDWKLLQHRRSCNLLTREQMQGGRVPTTPTIGSIIAGIQVQEAVKLLHGLPTMGGRGINFSGDSGEAYGVVYQRDPNCLSHDTLAEIVELDATSDTLRLNDLLNMANEAIGAGAVLDLGRDVAEALVCPICQDRQEVFRSLSTLSTKDARCPACETGQREVVTFTTVRGDEAFIGRTLSEIGVPLFDIITARNETRSIAYLINGDRSGALGSLADGGLEWI